MAKTCDVCGAPSGMYPLCWDCNTLKAEGKVIKDEKTGKWIKPQEKKIPKTEHQIKQISPEDDEEDFNLKCIICSNDSYKYFFCKECYHKYKNKTLLLKVTDGCKNIKLLDESWEGTYVCDDGHVVKSKAEREIDNYLYNRNIKHAYEPEEIIQGIKTHPDFYLPDKNAYIEHWGYDDNNIEYTKTKKQKLELYRQAGFTIICTYEKSDSKNISAALNYKIRDFKPGIINFEE